MGAGDNHRCSTTIKHHCTLVTVVGLTCKPVVDTTLYANLEKWTPCERQWLKSPDKLSVLSDTMVEHHSTCQVRGSSHQPTTVCGATVNVMVPSTTISPQSKVSYWGRKIIFVCHLLDAAVLVGTGSVDSQPSSVCPYNAENNSVQSCTHICIYI